jgi:hypothetical protein
MSVGEEEEEEEEVEGKGVGSEEGVVMGVDEEVEVVEQSIFSF